MYIIVLREEDKNSVTITVASHNMCWNIVRMCVCDD